jgi:hypothetical protein
MIRNIQLLSNNQFTHIPNDPTDKYQWNIRQYLNNNSLILKKWTYNTSHINFTTQCKFIK